MISLQRNGEQWSKPSSNIEVSTMSVEVSHIGGFLLVRNVRSEALAVQESSVFLLQEDYCDASKPVSGAVGRIRGIPPCGMARTNMSRTNYSSLMHLDDMDTTFLVTAATCVVTASNEETSTLWSAYLSYTLLTITAIAAFFGNFMVIVVIIRSSKLHNITWGLLLNLAGSDFLSASILVPMVISIQGPTRDPPGPLLCGFIGFIYTALAEASIWTLTMLSIERYCAVNQPLHYHQRVTRHRAIVSVVTLWLCVITWGTVPFVLTRGYVFKPQYGMCLPDFGGAATLASIVVGIGLPFVILCTMYISIGKTAFTQAQRKVVECDEENCRYVPPKHKDYRAVKTLAVLAGVFAICWLPFNITTIVDAFTPVASVVCRLSLALTFMNTAINPLLYSILNRTFRQAAMKEVRLCRENAVRCLEDNKVRPPQNGATLELEETTRISKATVNRLQMSHEIERNCVPLLPNQVPPPRGRTEMSPRSSPIEKFLAVQEVQPHTI